MTSEVPNEPTEASAGEAASAPAPEENAGASGPYRNLLVPLVVVPALIVMVLVAVFALFGAIAGEEATPAENLDRMLHGGQNERQQATFNLVVQTREALEARREGREPAWDIDATFLPKLNSAWDASVGEDPARRLVLAILIAELGEGTGMEYLTELSGLTEAVDPGGEVGLQAIISMGWVAERVPAEARRAAAEGLIASLEAAGDTDAGVRLASAATLPLVEPELARPVLLGLLGESSLEMRATAAISLAELGSDAGSAVLRDLLSTEVYEAERAAQPEKWVDERLVSASRRQALAALVAVGQQPPAEELRGWEEDPDLHFRNDILGLLGEPR